MEEWTSLLTAFATELRAVHWLHSLADASDDPHIIPRSATPQFLDCGFWSQRSHEIESLALKSLTNPDIDRIFDDVTSVMDENLDRFNPILEYYSRIFPDPDDAYYRMDNETEMAHAVKRDLAWIAVERVIKHDGFFSGLLVWYKLGRWPCAWTGNYPDGHVLCL